MALHDFTDEATAELLDMIRWFREREVESNPFVDDTDLGGAPEVYIARLVATLPGLTQNAVTGTGTGAADDDTPGSLSCDLYRIDDSGVMERVDISRTIYNVSSTAVTVSASGDAWVPVVRTKSGRWVASYICG